MVVWGHRRPLLGGRTPAPRLLRSTSYPVGRCVRRKGAESVQGERVEIGCPRSGICQETGPRIHIADEQGKYPGTFRVPHLPLGKEADAATRVDRRGPPVSTVDGFHDPKCHCELAVPAQPPT